MNIGGFGQPVTVWMSLNLQSPAQLSLLRQCCLHTAIYQEASMARLHDHTLQRSTTIIGSK
jgi:hypothetical protein